ncbi:histidine phosphatase family protein [Rheinheimera sp.]|uniref:SixA phosphatase family protein n=1 Tax=Rheinheimera sp. TaxID=1869214 RepID=UPI00307CDF5F
MKKLIVLLSVATCLQLQAWPQQIVVVRHAEKQPGSPDPELSLCGQQQALAMAALVPKPVSQVWHTGLNRTRQTAELMASDWPDARLATYPAADFSALMTALQQTEKNSLIVGHSNTVPDLLRQLSAQAAPELTEQDYGQVFILERQNQSYQWRMAAVQPAVLCQKKP